MMSHCLHQKHLAFWPEKNPSLGMTQTHRESATAVAPPLLTFAILDDDPLVRPACHVFVASKAPWFEITDDLPQYPEYAPTK